FVKQTPCMSKHAESQTHADIRRRHQYAWPEEGSDEGTSLRVFSRAAEIEEPDDGQILNVVPGLEHQESHLRPLSNRVRVREIRERDRDEDELERVGFVAPSDGFDDLEEIIRSAHDGHCNQAAYEPQKSRCRNESPAAFVIIGKVRRQVVVEHK